MSKNGLSPKITSRISLLSVGEDMTGGSGPILCFGVLILLTLLVGINVGPTSTIFLEGEIASQDVTAHQDLLVEDRDSTIRKKNHLAGMQPAVFDLSMEPFDRLKAETTKVLEQVQSLADEELNQKRWEISERINAEVSLLSMSLWARADFAELFTRKVLPRMQALYEKGVVADRQVLRDYQYGIRVRDLTTGVEASKVDPQAISDFKTLKDALDVYLRDELNLKIRSRKAVWDLIQPFARQNLVVNQDVTKRRAEELKTSLESVFYQIKKGEMIVREGERVTAEQQRKMQALMSRPPSLFQPIKALGFLLISSCLFFGLYVSSKARFNLRILQKRDFLLIGAMLLAFGCMAKFMHITQLGLSKNLVRLDPEIFPYSLPVAGAVGLLAFFLPRGVNVLACLLISYVGTSMVGAGLDLFLFYFLGGLFYIFLLKDMANRTAVIRTVMPLIGGLLVFWIGINLTFWHGFLWFFAGAGFVIVGGVLSLLLLLSISPIVEHLFGYTSRFRLMELMNLEQPLLQELMVSAPGTYHHSLIVANLVEAGARVIGADGLLAKVAALYHDIGKLKNPEYFIENQFSGKNKHDKLSPSMSALILTAHVKKGVEMAQEHKLGPEIIDLIQQHHGTSIISFFYTKAKDQVKNKDETEVREEDFRYPGPKPQTKEGGLILLADMIEASSRTLVDPTSSRIKGHIKSSINRVYAEGQLDESELTLRDLNQLTEVFHRILTGIFHHRIEYPREGKDRTDKTITQTRP